MEFIKAKHEDIACIMPIVREAVKHMNASGNFQWDKAYPTESVFVEDIQSEHLFLAKNKQKIAGFVCLNFHQPNEYKTIKWSGPEHALVIHRMVVAQKYRGAGVAKFLFEQAEKIALHMKLTAIRSDTNQANLAMNHLFEIFQYALTGTISLRNNPDRFNCYEKLLK